MIVDKHERTLKVGDLVMVPCIVDTLRDRDGYNIGLHTHHENFDGVRTILALSSRQCELVEEIDPLTIEG